MSIADLMSSDVPPELRVKIEKVMEQERLSWRDAVISLAREVVSPSAERARKTRRNRASFSCLKGGFTHAAKRKLNTEAQSHRGTEEV